MSQTIEPPEGTRTYHVIARRSQMGRTRVLIVCPYCGEHAWAYLWSLAGAGKRCPGCRAKHTSYGYTVAP